MKALALILAAALLAGCSFGTDDRLYEELALQRRTVELQRHIIDLLKIQRTMACTDGVKS